MTLGALSRSWLVRDFVFTPTFSTETGHGFLDALTWKLTFPDPRPPHPTHTVCLSTWLPQQQKINVRTQSWTTPEIEELLQSIL